ncbi:ATP-dependent helicase, partial [Rhodococcus sp. 14C212]|nr:ATP-dependent helicase [Rhodococcus sp. 14C212]
PAPVPPPQVAERVATADSLARLRKELNSLVAMHHHRTGKPHGVIHGELRRQCGGPPTAIATAEQLGDRIALLRQW